MSWLRSEQGRSESRLIAHIFWLHDGAGKDTNRVNCPRTLPFQSVKNFIFCRRTTSTNCYAYANHNQGCGTQFTKPASFGTSLNAIGGGWFAMERTNAGIKLWFWGRNDPTVPESVSQHNEMVSPDVSWGTPDASFPSSSTCDISKHFDEHMIVFDTTFCVSNIHVACLLVYACLPIFVG